MLTNVAAEEGAEWRSSLLHEGTHLHHHWNLSNCTGDLPSVWEGTFVPFLYKLSWAYTATPKRESSFVCKEGGGVKYILHKIHHCIFGGIGTQKIRAHVRGTVSFSVCYYNAKTWHSSGQFITFLKTSHYFGELMCFLRTSSCSANKIVKKTVNEFLLTV